MGLQRLLEPCWGPGPLRSADTTGCSHLSASQNISKPSLPPCQHLMLRGALGPQIHFALSMMVIFLNRMKPLLSETEYTEHRLVFLVIHAPACGSAVKMGTFVSLLHVFGAQKTCLASARCPGNISKAPSHAGLWAPEDRWVDFSAPGRAHSPACDVYTRLGMTLQHRPPTRELLSHGICVLTSCLPFLFARLSVVT